jgi:hypothetical protein
MIEMAMVNKYSTEIQGFGCYILKINISRWPQAIVIYTVHNCSLQYIQCVNYNHISTHLNIL